MTSNYSRRRGVLVAGNGNDDVQRSRDNSAFALSVVGARSFVSSFTFLKLKHMDLFNCIKYKIKIDYLNVSIGIEKVVFVCLLAIYIVAFQSWWGVGRLHQRAWRGDHGCAQVFAQGVPADERHVDELAERDRDYRYYFLSYFTSCRRFQSYIFKPVCCRRWRRSRFRRRRCVFDWRFRIPRGDQRVIIRSLLAMVWYR